MPEYVLLLVIHAVLYYWLALINLPDSSLSLVGQVDDWKVYASGWYDKLSIDCYASVRLFSRPYNRFLSSADHIILLPFYLYTYTAHCNIDGSH